MLATRNAPSRHGRAARAIGVEISSAAVRVVELESHGDTMRVTKRGQAPIPPDSWARLDEVRDDLVQAIRGAMSGAGIAPAPVATAVPRRLVTLKYAKLPHAAPEQLRGLVQFEAQQYIPFPIDEVVLDAQSISDATDDLATVMIVAARRSLVDSLLAVFDKAGLEVVRISVSALALAEHATAGVAPLGLLSVDSGEIDMAVVRDGRIVFTRAVELDSPLGSAQGRDALASEVSRSLAAYQYEYRMAPIGKLVLSAADSRLQDEVETMLSTMTDVPVGRMNGRFLPAADPDAQGYAVAIGLAVEATSLGTATINLIPPSREANKLAARRRTSGTIAVAALLVVLAAGFWFLLRSMAMSTEDRVARVRANSELQTDQATLSKAQKDHDAVNQVYQTVNAELQRNVPSVEIVKAISDSLPVSNAIYLTQLTFTRGSTLTIHGNARDEVAATDFVIALQNAGVFGDVRLGYIGDARSDTNRAATPAARPKLPKLPAGAKAPAGAPPAATPASAPGASSFIITCRMPDGSQPVAARGKGAPTQGAQPSVTTHRVAPNAGSGTGADDSSLDEETQENE